jgi:1-acyl-sn-glycerol-3-phosphate acyltransferase
MGYPAAPMYGGYPSPQQGNGLAVAGMVCGIVGLVLFWIPVLGWILAILAIIFSGVGIAKANKGASGKGQAVAGLVLGVVSIGL